MKQHTVFDGFKQQLETAGFDITHAFHLNDLGPMKRYLPIKQADDAAVAILVGNSKAVWRPFLQWLSEQPVLPDDPFEAYTMSIISSCTSAFYASATALWAHETRSYTVPIQQLAHASGLAYLSRGQFNIHPQYGPWFALRALVVVSGQFDGPINQLRPPANPVGTEVEVKSGKLFMQLCQRAYATSDHLRVHWEEWLALRDLYGIGTQFRYGDDQMRYHYTTDPLILDAALERFRNSQPE